MNRKTRDHPPGTILECEKCKTKIKLGNGGTYNLEQHIDSVACQAAAQKLSTNLPRKDGTLLGFLTKKVLLVPSTVVPLSNIHVPKAKLLSLPELSISNSVTNPVSSSSESLEPSPAVRLLDSLYQKLGQIPASLPEATNSHALAEFSADAAKSVIGVPADDWEDLLNPMFHRAFGWGNMNGIRDLIQRGQYGLDGFIKFVWYFAENRGLEDGCIREKVERIMEAIDVE